MLNRRHDIVKLLVHIFYIHVGIGLSILPVITKCWPLFYSWMLIWFPYGYFDTLFAVAFIVCSCQIASISRRHLQSIFFFNENHCILTQTSMQFFPEVLIDDKPALVQVMAWHRQAMSHSLPDPRLVQGCHHMASVGHNELIIRI